MKQRLFLSILLLVLASNAVLAQQTLQRAIAQSTHTYSTSGYKFTDTTVLTYNSARGYVPALKTWAMDTATQRTYNTVTSQYDNALQTCVEYYPNDLYKTSTLRAWIAGSWQPYIRGRYFVTGNKTDSTLLEVYQSGNWVPNYKDIYTTDGLGRVTGTLTLEWNTGAQAYQNDRRETNTYSGSNLTSTLIETHTGGNWQNLTVTNNIYDANGDMTKSTKQDWAPFSSTWLNNENTDYTYDASHNELTEIIQDWDGTAWVNQTKTTSTYNSGNFLVSETTQTWNTTSNQFEYVDNQDVQRWVYYGTYTSVKDLYQQTAIGLYPNPATNNLYIQLESKDSKPLALTIYDMTGKVVKHWYEAASAQRDKHIDISTLPAGNYIIKGGAFMMPQQFTIIR
jgi:hypothetical protein